MAMSMPPEELELLMAGYVLGDLDPEEAAAFAQVLAQHPEIAAEVTALQAALEATDPLPDGALPPDLRSRILAAADPPVAPAAIGLPDVPQRSPVPFSLKSPRSWLELAAAAMIVALGLNNYRLSQALQQSQAETRQYAALTYQLRATQANSPASAQVVVDPNTLKGKISVQNLPPLPPGQVYVLWTVLAPTAPFTTDAKDAILTQTFEVDDRGAAVQEVVVPVAFRSTELVTMVAVTVEDAAAPQKHVGKPIMLAKL